jgi:NitT/TauT family transport system substrate-binding protein
MKPSSRLPLLAALAVLAVGCRFQSDPRDGQGRRVFRVGYLPNLTHAPALWAIESGALSSALAPDAILRTYSFGAGPSIIEALFAGELDVAYVGPNPAINAFQRSRGQAVRAIAGATFGGAQLIVHSSISSPEQLAGHRLASPALGNTQDVALRRWLKGRDIPATVTPIALPEILQLFGRGQLVGAWVPEPWASRMVLEQQGWLLVDERDLWPQGRFPTTVVIASTAALAKRPDLVERLLLVNGQAIRSLSEEPSARAVVAAHIARALGKPLPQKVLERAFDQLSFSPELSESELAQLAQHAQVLGLLKEADVSGLVPLRNDGASQVGAAPGGGDGPLAQPSSAKLAL